MTTVTDLLERHNANMKQIQTRDRDSTLSLSVLHSMMLYDTAAWHVAQKGNAALAAILNKHASSIFEVIRGPAPGQVPEIPIDGK